MPMLTRSCSKQKGRPRIEEETPTTTDTNRRRYPTRSSAKRKIIEQENEGKALEPPSKRAASSRSSNNVPKSAKSMPLQEIKNTINQHKRDGTKSSKGHESRIPRRRCNNNVSKNNKTDLTQSNDKLVNNTTDNNNNQRNISHRSPSFEQSDFNLNSVPADNEAVPKTPAGCIAARIRSYSALRRSQRKKRGQVHSDGDKENLGCCPTSTMSPSEEISSNQSMTMEMENSSELRSDVESDEDILLKMSKRHIDEKEDTIPEDKSDNESSYKNKYFTLMTAMKQLQNTFLKAQQNAERNVKAYDNFVSNLKSSLSTEKQKNSLLSEELKIKKGTVERLRSDLENTKEQLEYMKEEKVNTEKQDKEKSEKNKDLCGKGLEENDKELPLVEDQRRVIKFYSQLTGITLSQENTCQEASSFQSFNCTFYPAANNSHCLQFRLTHDKEFDEIEYSPNPRSPGSEDVLMSLPNYLQENIFFGADQAPRFLAKLLKTVE